MSAFGATYMILLLAILAAIPIGTTIITIFLLRRNRKNRRRK